MSPSLVKWIPHSIAFSFQDWFMPERDLRSGRASIAARGASQPAGQPLHLTSCGCFTWILLTSSCSLLFSPSLLILRRAKRPDATPGNASYAANGKRFICTPNVIVPMKFITACIWRQCLSPNVRYRRMRSEPRTLKYQMNIRIIKNCVKNMLLGNRFIYIFTFLYRFNIKRIKIYDNFLFKNTVFSVARKIISMKCE